MTNGVLTQSARRLSDTPRNLYERVKPGRRYRALRFGILGPLELTDAERPVRIGGPKVRTLLAALLVEANKVVSADQLCAAMWPDAEPSGQLNALQTQVSRLRAVVAPPTDPAAESRLLSRGQGYVLTVADDELDAIAFEKVSRQARDGLAAGDWTEASRAAEEALALWRGIQALAEYRYEDFARARAAQLDEQRLLTIECRIDARLALGHHRDLTGDLQELVTQHPLREQLWCQLVLALYRSDRQSEALRAYEQVRRILADELGINPCTELVRLERAVLDQDPSLDWLPPTPTGTGGATTTTGGRTGSGSGRDTATDVAAGAADADAPASPTTEAAGTARPVTFLLTDIEHSTLLWDRDPVAMAEALRVHDRLLRNAIESHGGHVFGRPGDGFCAVFDRASNAVEAALQAQSEIRAATRSEHGALRVRVAIHTGEAEQREGNFFGAAVNRVARLRDAAHGGQILVSATARELVVDGMPTEAELTDIGTWLFEGLSRAERVYQLDHPGLDGGFPPLRSGRPHTGTIPRHSTSFVGRQHESERTVAALRAGPLVTVTGEGGVGKTRLALEILQRATVADYPDGVWFCDVSLVDDADGLAEAMAAALKLSTPPGSNVRTTVIGALHDSRLLLLVDNSERLREAVAELVGEILQAGPEATILATSRAPLRTSGEQVIQLDPLGLPDRNQPESDPATAPAVRLLLDRAHSAGAPVAEDDPALVDIAHRLDGMPLAIELAAPRLAIMSPAALASRLDRRFDLLKAPTLPPRQRTLRATIDWSFELLEDDARRLFGALSVFRGGFTLDTAEMIAASVGLHPDAVAPLIADLADQSMIRAELPAQGSARYKMLDTMQAYAADYLVTIGLQEAVHAQHSRYFVELAERAALYRRGPLEPAWVTQVEIEFDNMRVAYRWSIEAGEPTDALRLVAALTDDATMRERFEIGRWAAELADLPALADDPNRSVALALAGNTAMMEYRLDDARQLSQEALAVEQAAGLPTRSWIAHNTLAMLRAAEGTNEFRSHLQAMVEISDATGDPTPAAVADYNRSLFALLLGQPERGLPAAERLLALGAETDNPTIKAMALVAHGQAVSASEPELAARRYHEALAAASSAHNTLVAQHCLRAIEALKARSGDRPAALESLRMIAQGFEQSGNVAEQLQTVISMLDSLVALDALVPAATICGALAQTPGRFTAVWRLIDRTVADKLPREEYVAARRVGAAMPPSELVAFASGLVKELVDGR